jgi:raffinose/stachyose/melibiose transport system substrate-binding protein
MKGKLLMAALILSMIGLPQVFAQKLSGKVVMYHYMSQKVKNDGLLALENEFKKLNPEVSFENNLIVQTNYFSTIRQLVAAGETPDIIMGQPSQYPDIIGTGVIKDQTGETFVKSASLSKGDINDSSFQGKMYAFPFDFKSYGIFYNKEIFKKLNLSVPKTHAELIAVAEKLKAAGIDPFIRCYADQVFPDIEIRAYFWAALIKSGQTDAWKVLMAGKKKFADYPEWTKALELWTQRMKFSRIDDMVNDQSKSYDLFVGAKGAMLYQGTWSAGDIMARNPKFDIGFFAIPTDKGAGSFCLQVDDLYMVNGKSAGGKIAQKFMEFCMTPAAATIWSKITLQPSLVAGVDTKPLPAFLQDVIVAKEANLVAHAGEWDAQIYGEFVTTYRMLLQEYAADQLSSRKLTISSFTDKLQKAWDAIVATK